MEELEHALKKYNMGGESTIKEIIAEVDTDHVWFFSFVRNNTNILLYLFVFSSYKLHVSKIDLFYIFASSDFYAGLTKNQRLHFGNS